MHTHTEDLRFSGWRIVAGVLSAAVSLALLDLLIAVAYKPAFMLVLRPPAIALASNMVVALCVVGLFGAAFGVASRRWFARTSAPLFSWLFLGFFLLFGIVSISDIFSLFPVPTMQSIGAYLLRLGLAGALAVATLTGAVGAARALSKRTGTGRACMGALYAWPLLPGSGIVLLWLAWLALRGTRHAWAQSTLSRGTCAALFAATLAAALIGAVALYRSRSGKRAALVWAVVALAIMAAPLATDPAYGLAKRGAISDAATEPDAPQHILFVVVDTLRANSLSCYGATRLETPVVDALAEDAVRFANAQAPSPWTKPSMASIMTGMSPMTHAVNALDALCPDEFTTLAETLSANGYDCGSIGTNVLLRPEIMNLDQGFDQNVWFPLHTPLRGALGLRLARHLFPGMVIAEGTGSELNALAQTWYASRRDARTFLWLHYFEPHSPYAPSAAHLPPQAPPAGLGNSIGKAELAGCRLGDVGYTAEQREWIQALHEGEIRDNDDALGQLFDALRAEGLYDDMLIVFVSDHGEEFWDHGGIEHGRTLYQEVVHVPLIVKLPRSTTRGVRTNRVTTTSLMPTVLDLCGIDYDAAQFEADSLAPLLRDANAAGPETIIGGAVRVAEPRQSVIQGDWKYVVSLMTGYEELYNLQNDPEEQVNLLPLAPIPQLASMRTHLEDARSAANARREALSLPFETRTEIDADTEELIRSIGYIE